jgi:hypothetical protein
MGEMGEKEKRLQRLHQDEEEKVIPENLFFTLGRDEFWKQMKDHGAVSRSCSSVTNTRLKRS